MPIALFHFLRPIFIPALAFSLATGFVTLPIDAVYSLNLAGLAVIVLSPFFHYNIYDVRRPNEYWFYYNLGLARATLWAVTVSAGTVLGLFLYAI